MWRRILVAVLAPSTSLLVPWTAESLSEAAWTSSPEVKARSPAPVSRMARTSGSTDSWLKMARSSIHMAWMKELSLRGRLISTWATKAAGLVMLKCSYL